MAEAGLARLRVDKHLRDVAVWDLAKPQYWDGHQVRTIRVDLSARFKFRVGQKTGIL